MTHKLQHPQQTLTTLRHKYCKSATKNTIYFLHYIDIKEKRMTTLRISGMVFQCVFEGSLSMEDTEIERRPYHKNCNCALHRSKGGACSNACPQRNISFPKKQSWTDASLCVSAATSKASSHPRSTSSGNKELAYGVQTLSQRQYTEVTEACR